MFRDRAPVWSPDGTRVAVWAIEAASKPWWQILDTDRGPNAPVPDPLPEPDSKTGFWPYAWSPDSRRLAMRDDLGIWLVDPEKGSRTLLLEVGGYALGRSMDVAGDGKVLTDSETAAAGEIWLATFAKGPGQ